MPEPPVQLNSVSASLPVPPSYFPPQVYVPSPIPVPIYIPIPIGTIAIWRSAR